MDHITRQAIEASNFPASRKARMLAGEEVVTYCPPVTMGIGPWVPRKPREVRCCPDPPRAS